MTRYERVEAAVRGKAVDRVPVSFWQHFPGHDDRAEALAEATVRYQQRFDLDVIKLMPTGMYAVMDYGVVAVPSGDEIGTTRYAAGPVRRPEDWARLPRASPQSGALAEQVRAVALVRAGVGAAVPILQTIFSPLTVAAKIAGPAFMQLLHASEACLPDALARLAEDVIAFGLASLSAGADGFFFATQLATPEALAPDDYARWGTPYDLAVLEALRPRAWVLLLHLHGNAPFFSLADHYPIDAVNWHARETEPTLARALALTRRGLAGGVARMGPVLCGGPADVVVEVQDAIAQTGGRRLLVAPGCVLPVSVPEENLRALRRAVA